MPHTPSIIRVFAALLLSAAVIRSAWASAAGERPNETTTHSHITSPHNSQPNIIMPDQITAPPRQTATPPDQVATPPDNTFQTDLLRESPARPKIGARLLALLRDGHKSFVVVLRAPHAKHIVRKLGLVLAEIGPIFSMKLTRPQLFALLPHIDFVDTPQPLRPVLDHSRREVGVAEVESALQVRGRDTLIAFYDSGLDLQHPDLHHDTQNRVLGYWDQDATGTPPAGFSFGHHCDPVALANENCAQAKDPLGHGTYVAAIAASHGETYRGMAPESALLMASALEFENLLPALEWFATTAAEWRRPMVVNLSLGGHQGAHDGSSLEAQAIETYPHLVVTAAGNEGDVPVHASTSLAPAETGLATLVFPATTPQSTGAAVIEVWAQNMFAGRLQFYTATGTLLATTSSVSPGSPGRTEQIEGPGLFARIALDAEAEPNPLNGRFHLRIAIDGIPDSASAIYVVVALTGGGLVHLWIDTPATQPETVRFDDVGLIAGLPQAFFGDVQHTLSDIASAPSALAVSAYAARVDSPKPPGGQARGYTAGALAPFSAYGPTLDPVFTGPKPEIAAPGFFVVAAKSRESATSNNDLSALYRIGGGTSASAPHVSGAAALLLELEPASDKHQLKKRLLESARSADLEPNDARWGHGKLQVAKAAGLLEAQDEGCACGAIQTTHGAGAWRGVFVVILSVCIRRGTRRRCR